MIEIYLWMQSVDNSSRDFVVSNGTLLSVEDTSQRQNVISKITSLAFPQGKVLFDDQSGFRIEKQHGSFLVKMQSTWLDDFGRSMPIMFAVYNFHSTEQTNELLASLKKSFQAIGYEINEHDMSIVSSKIEASLSRIDFSKKKVLLGGAALLLILIALLRFLKK